MQCLSEETILAFCQGGLGAAARAEVQEHIASCDECRALVSAVARSSLVPVARHAPDDEARGSASKIHPVTTGVGMLPDPAIVAAHALIDGPRSPPSRSSFEAPRSPPSRSSFEVAMAPTTPIGKNPAPPSAPTSPVRPGDLVDGKYRVERVLGAGGMGVVVAARHMQLDQRVALKFLLPVACEVQGAVARFLREGKAAARITSEHVARVIDTGTLAGGAPYLVMEYLEGADLHSLLEDRGALPVADAVEYVLQACEAIAEAHALGVVHRDLKPANLFLAHRADGTPLVKVLDFGISKLESTGTRSELTSASMIMGSPRYMSPEQMLAAKHVDARTDVWALGVILFELVTARPAWTADTVQGLCALITSAPAPPLRAYAPHAPELLERVVAACLTKARDARIASVADLAILLEPVAPPVARTSIERILRVGRRARPPSGAPQGAGSAPPLPVAPSVPKFASEGPITATAASSTAASTGRVAALLAIAVGGLLVAGVTWNAVLSRRAERPRPAEATAETRAPGGETPSPAAPPEPASAQPIDLGRAHGGAQPIAVALPASAEPAATITAAPAKLPLTPRRAAPRTAPQAVAPPPRTAPVVAPPPAEPARPAETSRALSDRK